MTLGHDGTDTRPMLVVRMKNLSRRQLCFTAEAIENPGAFEMHVRMRDRNGRPVKFRDSGFLLPPMPGLFRLEPGADVVRAYHFVDRFKLKLPNGPLPRGMTVQAEVQYGYCDGPRSFRAVSEWYRF